MKKFIKAIIILFVFGLLFILSFFTIVHFSLPVVERMKTVNVTGKIPDYFPVVIIHKDDGKNRAEIVYHKNLGNYTKDISYLIPSGEENQLNSNMSSQVKMKYSKGETAPWRSDFKIVKTYSNGEQLLRVEYDEDDDDKNIGWYIAGKDGIKAQKYLSYFGPGLLIAIFPYSLALAGLFCAAISLVLFFLKKRKKTDI